MKDVVDTWEDILMEAANKAMAAVKGAGAGGTLTVGTGASGDKTLVGDKRAEDAIISVLQRRKDLGILSEEAGSIGEGREFLAVVDPLDGSSNYSRGIPFYATSIAIARGQTLEDVEAGMVMNLITGERYAAFKGRGARKDGRPLAGSKLVTLKDAAVGLDLSGSGGQALLGAMGVVKASKRQVHFGANALELCMVAEGALDCFVDLRGKMRVTDVAAALLVLRESGGTFSGANGEALNPSLDLAERVSVLASGNPRLHEGLVASVSG